MSSYKNLDIYIIAKKLAIDVHKMSLTLPRFELYEEGSQIRRSSKSVTVNIVEGYGRRKYKNDFIKYIIIALAECDETLTHLELLHATGSLTNNELYLQLRKDYDELSKKLNRFYQSIILHHNS